MGGKLRRQSPDIIIGALADLQNGVVARWQLLARGVTSREIERRIADGRLRPIHRGVYLVGHVWVTTPREDSSRPGLIVRKAVLQACDITSKERIRVTTAARTILDCAAVLPRDEDYRLEGMCASD